MAQRFFEPYVVTSLDSVGECPLNQLSPFTFWLTSSSFFALLVTFFNAFGHFSAIKPPLLTTLPPKKQRHHFHRPHFGIKGAVHDQFTFECPPPITFWLSWPPVSDDFFMIWRLLDAFGWHPMMSKMVFLTFSVQTPNIINVQPLLGWTLKEWLFCKLKAISSMSRKGGG